MNDNQIIDGALNYLADFVKNYSAMAGTIKMFAGSVAPDGWLLCNGQAVSRTTYSKLFNVIGTTYGEGDGSTTFNLPDLRGRVPLGAGTGDANTATAHDLGQKAGAETHVLTNAQLPKITKTFRIRAWGTSGGWPISNVSGYTVANYNGKEGVIPSSSSEAKSENVSWTIGGNSAHNNMQPYLAVNYIICTGDDLDLNPSTNPEFRSGSGTVTVPVAASGSPLVLLATLPPGLWEVKLCVMWPNSAGTINKNFGIYQGSSSGTSFCATPAGASNSACADSVSRIIKIDGNTPSENKNIYLSAWQGSNSDITDVPYRYTITQLGGVVDRDYDYPIGERRQISGSLSSLASANSTKVKVDTLPNGIWLISSRVEYDANATGERSLNIYTNGSVGAGYVRRTASQGSNATTVLTAHKVVEINNNTVNRDVQLGFWQNSGSALNINNYYYYATQIGGNVDTQYINGAVFGLKSVTVTGSSIAAGSTAWQVINAPENAVSLTGWYIDASAGSNSLANVYAARYDSTDNTARIAIRNNGTVALTPQVTAQFLCVTNTQPVFVDNTYSNKVDALETTVNNLNQDIFAETYVDASHHSTAYLQGRCYLIKIKGPARTLILGRGWFRSTNNVNIVSSTYLFEIPSGWRPTSDVQGNCMVQFNESGGASGYSVIVGTNGVVTESFGSTVRGGSFTFHYFIAN